MALEQLCRDAQWHWLPPGGVVPRVHKPSALTFLRDYVAQNKPCILTGLIDHWPALTEWASKDALLEQLGRDKKLTVNLTPNGKGDNVVEEEGGQPLFIKPFEAEMTAETFFANLCKGGKNVAYLSSQNDNVNKEMPELKASIDERLSIAVEAFGNEPEATNVWIGDQRAVSSLHKDFYENMYCVVKGTKVFHLLPPCAQPFVYETECTSAHYEFDAESEIWSVVKESDTTSWSMIDPDDLLESSPNYKECLERFPLARKAAPLTLYCQVTAGETLYLPAMWFHRVTQLEETVAINYWHDMQFDLKWLYHNYLDASTKETDE